MDKMRNCHVCRKKFDVSLLQRNSRDEYFCRECFKTESPKASASGDCGQSPHVLTRSDCNSANCMFKDHDAEAYRSQMLERYVPKVNSKIPMKCPHADCNIYISSFDLSQHFAAEHRNIPMNMMRLDKPTSAKMDMNDVRYTISQFISIFNVFHPESEGNKPVTNVVDKGEVPLTVALATSRITANDIDDDASVVVDELAARKHHFAYDDMIIFWLTSNIPVNLHYSIAVSSKDERIRMKYFGKLHQIGNDTRTLCKDAQCLILHEFQALKLSENGNLPLKLDFVVHKEI